ncbi:MAG TPA: EAL domain-containing protein, partial [Nitrospiria bacterium]|nr:EAL domain-containing protein [Nitrospiria bacterium]
MSQLGETDRHLEHLDRNLIETVEARTASTRTRLVQLARLHERASDDIRRQLIVQEQRAFVTLATVIVASAMISLAVMMVVLGHIRRLFARQAAADQAFYDSERRLRQILDSMNAFVGLFSLDGRVIEANRTPLVAADLSLEEVVGTPVWETPLVSYSTETQAQVKSALARAAAGETVREDIPVQVTGGQIVILDSTFAPLYNAQGRITMVIGSGVDVSARKQAEARHRTMSIALEQTADNVLITDIHGRIEYVNHAFSHTTGYTAAEAIGRTPNLMKSGKHGTDFYRRLWETILAGAPFTDVFINRRKDGTFYSEEKTITPLKDAGGRITHFVSTGRDITERIQTQERLRFLANHDALTGLPNRTLFLDRLEQAISRSRWRKRSVAVLFVDLDRFKNINDSLGHTVGDELLRALATRLSSALRDGDTVARFGGDEFVILLDDVANATDVGVVAKKVLDALTPPVNLGTTLQVGASIGVSICPADGEDPGTLLKNADIAMYRAKEAGRNTCEFYSQEMSTRAFERMTIESTIRQALARKEFTLHYQPQVDVRSGTIVAVEALLRWQHPDLGLVAPNQFIPVLEDTGRIVEVGEWLLAEACAQAARWRANGAPDLRMAVNLSGRQFLQPTLAAVVTEALARAGVPPEALEVEITESMLMRPTDLTQQTIKTLDDLGVRFGLDDFGTGYSSLSYLQRFPFDTLKIDRSFVRDLPADEHDAALARAILAMGRSLKLELVAEGVETDAQRDFLLAHQCVMMQGYLFSRPLPADEIGKLLRDPRRMLPRTDV